jgi:hypothetical protein
MLHFFDEQEMRRAAGSPTALLDPLLRAFLAERRNPFG